MQIIDKAITPDGIKIELRDLSGEHKLPDYNGMIIVFRTIAKKTFPPKRMVCTERKRISFMYLLL